MGAGGAAVAVAVGRAGAGTRLKFGLAARGACRTHSIASPAAGPRFILLSGSTRGARRTISVYKVCADGHLVLVFRAGGAVHTAAVAQVLSGWALGAVGRSRPITELTGMIARRADRITICSARSAFIGPVATHGADGAIKPGALLGIPVTVCTYRATRAALIVARGTARLTGDTPFVVRVSVETCSAGTGEPPIVVLALRVRCARSVLAFIDVCALCLTVTFVSVEAMTLDPVFPNHTVGALVADVPGLIAVAGIG